LRGGFGPLAVWDGVIAAATPGMTAKNPANAEGASFEGAVKLNGFEKVV